MPTDIMECSPRELSKVLATEIFRGWPKHQWLGINKEVDYCGYCDKLEKPENHNDADRCLEWNPAENLNQAVEIVHKMMKYCHVSMFMPRNTSMEHDGWACWPEVRGGDSTATKQLMPGDTLPMAICRATFILIRNHPELRRYNIFQFWDTQEEEFIANLLGISQEEAHEKNMEGMFGKQWRQVEGFINVR